LSKVAAGRTDAAKDKHIDELEQKLVQVKGELNDLKLQYQLKCKQLEQEEKEKKEL